MKLDNLRSVGLVHAALAQTPAVLGHIFTVNCKPLTIQRADPILFPGLISPHVHSVVGGTAFALAETNEQARAANATTCDKTLDNSNYWQPQLYHQRLDGRFELVEMQGIAAYYIDRACDYVPGRQNCNDAPHGRAPPAGLRMIVGNPHLRTYDASNPEQRAISHICLGSGFSHDTPHLPSERCERLRAETYFPSCWDGISLDSPNHKSHMAFPSIGDYNTGVCPPSHPKAILSVFLEFFYDTAAVKNFNRWVWAMGDPTGYGLHGDFINGWTDQQALERAMDTCTGPLGVDDARCSLNVGPNGPGQPSPRWPEVEPPKEEVGLGGPLERLPGDNPVTGAAEGGGKPATYGFCVLHETTTTQQASHLVTHSLASELPPFTALSYVWGDSADTVTASWSGNTVSMTRNLSAILQCLTSSSASEPMLLVWIDALCINQADLGERAEQSQAHGPDLLPRGSLDVLSHVCQYPSTRGQLSALPSWVPDWTATVDETFHHYYSERTRRMALSDGSMGLEAEWQRLGDGRVSTKAMIIGHIKTTALGIPDFKS
ncbi:hypothetical protein L249_2572 [Ophiocordyceps polyrhachis-furcata BCC 54312]|uniref:DUF1996 domain-containing protein n=1 Tax=Ophiocordyceps polyrhachis-furcata BCC 54312 TaxID=1330021 RepID=A0A367LQL8_9HYPO|nr:hypothetical protein L249_2572 [Ophiocordyceps polyrhachis-furcata BCC 54312]